MCNNQRTPNPAEALNELAERYEDMARQMQEAVSAIIDPPVIQFQVLSDGAASVGLMPLRFAEGDAGYDLYVSRRALVLVDGFTDVHTDIAIALPPGYFGRVTGRSSTLRQRGLLVNEGIIDNGYRGELFVAAFNLGVKPVVIEAGERIAQLIIHRIESPRWEQTLKLPPSVRGAAGFGSTGP